MIYSFIFDIKQINNLLIIDVNEVHDFVIMLINNLFIFNFTNLDLTDLNTFSSWSGYIKIFTVPKIILLL